MIVVVIMIDTTHQYILIMVGFRVLVLVKLVSRSWLVYHPSYSKNRGYVSNGKYFKHTSLESRSAINQLLTPSNSFLL
jgi:hypothetical protein